MPQQEDAKAWTTETLLPLAAMGSPVGQEQENPSQASNTELGLRVDFLQSPATACNPGDTWTAGGNLIDQLELCALCPPGPASTSSASVPAWAGAGAGQDPVTSKHSRHTPTWTTGSRRPLRRP